MNEIRERWLIDLVLETVQRRMPAAVLISGAAIVCSVAQFGAGWPAVALAGFSLLLVLLTLIDLEAMLLPDLLTLPLLVAGLLLHTVAGDMPLIDSAIGALFGYCSLWLPFLGFKLATGKEGMGYGDFKLLAAIGAWVGWPMVPFVVLLACCTCLAAFATRAILLDRPASSALPFGPFLAAAGWGVAVFGQQIHALM